MSSHSLLLLLLALFVSNGAAFESDETARQVSAFASVSISGCVSFTKPFNRPEGAACSCGNQCASKSCVGNVCRCRFDKHCPDGRVCVTPPWGPRICSTSNRPTGAPCLRNKQCASSRCERRRCVCEDDGDCPEGQECVRRRFRPNICRPTEVTTKEIGSPCNKNSQCATGRCEKGECVCNDNGDCPAGQICIKPVFNKNYCVDAGRPLGASCSKNKQCASKKCEKKTCVCNDNADCPNGKRCKKRAFKKNICV